MNLIAYEFGKVARLPVIWVYFIACICFNHSELQSNLYFFDSDYLEYVNEVTEEIGGVLGDDFEKSLEKLPDNQYKSRLLSETEGLGDVFQTIDVEELGQVMIEFSGITESDTSFANKTKAMLEKNFTKLSDVTMKKTEVSLLAGSQSQTLFDILFKILFPAIVAQTTLLSVIVMMFLADFEEMAKTNMLIYATKKGREIQKTKLITGCLIGLGFYFALSVILFSIYFHTFSISNIMFSTLDTPYLSIKVHLLSFPFLTWQTLTFLEYFLWIFLLSTIFILIFTLLAWVVGMLFQNLYYGFIAYGVGVTLQLLAYTLAYYNQFVLVRYVMEFSPLILFEKMGLWLSYMGFHGIIPYQETWSISMLFLLILPIITTIYNIFTRKDILT